MYCTWCGKKIDDDSQFCCYCGTEIAKEPEQNNIILEGIINNVIKDIQEENEKSINLENENNIIDNNENKEETSYEENKSDIENKEILYAEDIKEENIEENNINNTIVEESNNQSNTSSEEIEKQKRKKPIVITVVLLLVAFFTLLFTIDGPKSNISEMSENVLYLEVYDNNNEIVGTASGFLVNDNKTLITNYHVMENAYKIIAYKTLEEKAKFNIIRQYDKKMDLAILKSEEGINAKPLILADSEKTKQGDKIYVIGYPLGLTNTMSEGIVSSRYINEKNTDIVQITAPISRGSSGSAVLNKKGEVTGIVSEYYIDAQNMNISIASNELKKLLNDQDKNIKLKNFYEKNHSKETTKNKQKKSEEKSEIKKENKETKKKENNKTEEKENIKTKESNKSKLTKESLEGIWYNFSANSEGRSEYTFYFEGNYVEVDCDGNNSMMVKGDYTINENNIEIAPIENIQIVNGSFKDFGNTTRVFKIKSYDGKSFKVEGVEGIFYKE